MDPWNWVVWLIWYSAYVYHFQMNFSLKKGVSLKISKEGECVTTWILLGFPGFFLFFIFQPLSNSSAFDAQEDYLQVSNGFAEFPPPSSILQPSLPVPKLSSPHREHRPESIRFEKNLHPAGVSYTGTFIDLATLKNEIWGNYQFTFLLFPQLNRCPVIYLFPNYNSEQFE